MKRLRYLLVLVLLGCASVAYAYLDPGTGSYIVQLLIGGLLGGLFAVGLFWRRVIAWLRRLFGPKPK
jgi:Na+/proline symporter